MVDKLDLLFVIDNSDSMGDEQARLVAQLPQLFSKLTTGMRSPTDQAPFAPFTDLHVGMCRPTWVS